MNAKTYCRVGIALFLLLTTCTTLHAGEKKVWRMVNYDRGLGAGDLKTNRNCGETALMTGTAPEGKKFLRWSVDAHESFYALFVYFGGTPRDLTPFTTLTFWISAWTRQPAGRFQLRLRTDESNEFKFYMQEIRAKKWRQLRIPLAAFHTMGRPDPKRIYMIALCGFRTPEPFQIFVDDFCLVEDPDGWDSLRREKTGFQERLEFDSASPYRSEIFEGRDEGRHVVWVTSGRQTNARMLYRLIPADLRPYENFRFRIRAESPLKAGAISLRFTDTDSGCLALDLPGIPAEWTTMTIPLGVMRRSGGFLPSRMNLFILQTRPGLAACVHVDDLEFLRGTRGDRSWEAQTLKALDFTDPRTLFLAEGFASTVRTSKEAEPGSIDWVVPAGPDMAKFKLRGIPADMEPFGSIRIRAKASRATKRGEIHVRLASSSHGYLAAALPPLSTEWKEVKIRLSAFTPFLSVDPSRIRAFELMTGRHDPLTVSLQWLRFVEGKRKPAPARKPGKTRKPPEPKPRDRGAKEEEPPLPRLLPKPPVPPLLARAARRGRKGARIEIPHFEVYTDQRAVTRALVRALEPMHDFIVNRLSIKAREGKIPVYIFKNKSDYVDFCVESAGYQHNVAEQSAGHGCSRYLAFYYTQPDDPVLVHEMAHALVHRSLGPFGGCWLQEGLAVSVERAYFEKDGAREFRSNLRSGNFTSLSVFLGLENFVTQESKTMGDLGPQLYAQSAAFFLFLRNGPYRDKFSKALRRLTSEPSSDADRVTMLEGLLGKPLGEIESDWIRWGKNR
ncbi:MAG: hypothetical protein ACYS47_17545 [Planctomycetota bacterium]